MQQDSESNLKLDLQTNSTRFHVLVGLTGSVAALKAPLLVTQLLEIPGVSVFIFRQIKLYASWQSHMSSNVIFISHICPLESAVFF